jgi:hypothetical protein
MFTDMNGNPWTTGAINDLTIGIKGTADDAYGRRDNEFPLESCVSNTNWDESAGADWIITVQDNLDVDYLHTDDIGAVLAYTIDDGPTSEWSIHQGLSDGFYNGITISSRSCRNAVTGNAKYKMFVKYNGTFYYSSEYTRNSTTYVTSNWDMVTRPWDAQPWENSDFDPATTEFGIEVTDLSEVGLRLRVTEFHITPEIEFGMGELRCTQMYATVVYSEPTPTPCLLPKPIDIQVNCDYETMGLNFWSGNREVYSLGRSSKRTSLSGVMWDGCTNGVDTCEDIIACVRALAKLQRPIEIDGLRYNELDCIYNILSFSWNQVSECPNTYDWNLELEFAHSCCTV